VTRQLVVGAVLLGAFVTVALLAPWLPFADPSAERLTHDLQPPSLAHPFGQDKLGRDILSRVAFGSRVSLLVGATVALVSTLLGVAVGTFAGMRGGRTDEIIARLIDIVLAFPGMLLVVGLAAVLGPSLRNTVWVLCLTGWTGYARLVRAEVIAWRGREFVRAAAALGAAPRRILLRHILPQIVSPVLVQATFGMAGVIAAEAGLSFLGLGVQPPTPSWGAMVNEGRSFLLIAPHVAIFPGMALMLLVLALNLIGEGLRDQLDRQSHG